jgi:hypothetical protein
MLDSCDSGMVLIMGGSDKVKNPRSLQNRK